MAIVSLSNIALGEATLEQWQRDRDSVLTEILRRLAALESQRNK